MDYEIAFEDKKKAMVGRTSSYVANVRSDMSFRSEMADNSEKLIRRHKIEAIAKFTLAFSCIIFFFIGAPLGAIIRKGGLGLPVIISVLIFIVYYILENSGTRMVRIGAYNLWFGCLLSTAVLTPLAAFFTYKANNDSAVFNMDLYKEFFQRLFGIRNKRHIFANEVIINIWDWNRDWKVEVTENGKKLNVSQVTMYDPLHILAYSTHRPEGAFSTSTTRHAFKVVASSASSTLEIRVTDRFGNVYTESMKRPKAFSIDAYNK